MKVDHRFRGREMAHPQIGLEVQHRFADAVSEYATVEKPPKLEGRSMLMFLAPIAAKEPPKPKAPKKEQPAAEGEAK